eukprot:COSAG05_NODE_3379_length_2100_cov_1.389805_1_plen_62_part_10
MRSHVQQRSLAIKEIDVETALLTLEEYLNALVLLLLQVRLPIFCTGTVLRMITFLSALYCQC